MRNGRRVYEEMKKINKEGISNMLSIAALVALLTLIVAMFAMSKCNSQEPNYDEYDIEDAEDAAELAELKYGLIKPSAVVEAENMALSVSVPANPAEPEHIFTDEDVELIAKALYGEAQGVRSRTNQAAVVWCILNRVDYGYGTIAEVVKADCAFAFSESNLVLPDLYDLSLDVLLRWEQEKAGEVYVGRVLPKGYLWMRGDGIINHFRNDYFDHSTEWNWEWGSPYEN